MNNKWINYMFPVVVIIIGGFVLFNLAFMSLGIFFDLNNIELDSLLLFGGYLVSAIVLFGITRYFLPKKEAKDTIIATLLTLPLMVIIVSIGIRMHLQPDYLIIGLCALVFLPIIIAIKRLKLSWVYWLACGYVIILGLLIMIFDIQI